jgi:hypothetical protein
MCRLASKFRLKRFGLPTTPTLGDGVSARWTVLAAGHIEGQWSPVCALSYAARIGNFHIDFCSFADADPTQWHLYDSSVRAAVTTLLEKYRWCKNAVKEQTSFREGFTFSTTSIPHDLREKSLTPLTADYVQCKVPFSRQDEPHLPCLPAALANITAGDDIDFATAVIDSVSPDGEFSTRFSNLRQLSAWLRHSRQAFQVHGRVP